MRNCSDRIRGNGCKLKEGKIRLGNRKNFSSKGGEAWNRLPREAVDAPFLELFKTILDGALSSLFW